MLAALPVVLFASVGSADLAGLGLPAARAAALSAFAASSGMPRSGVLSRAAQLEFGVGAGVLSDEEARAIVVEQPEFLRCGFGLALETEQLVVVEKPFDTLLTPDKAGPRWAGELSLREWLRREHPSTQTEAGDEVRLCHNLDFATSGLLVAAKSRAAANDVASCFRERTARKLYVALVFGHPAWDTHTWTDRIQPSQRRFKQRISKAGKTAHTDAAVAARGVLRVGEHAGREASLLWLQPRTGRRHQLRLHASHGGHAIVGDYTYAADRLMYRMFLHAAALELPLDHGPHVRALAPLVPAGWGDVFEAREPPRDPPEGWEGAANALLGSSAAR